MLIAAALEVGIRVLLPQFNPSDQVYYLQSDRHAPPLGPPNTQFRQRKNSGDYDVSVAFNSHGLRDAKSVARAEESDWLVVGDSFSMGMGVQADERYSNRLDAALDAAVYNISIPTDVQGYEKLLSYARQLGAKAQNIVVGVCMENDLRHYTAMDTPPTTTTSLDYLKAFLTYRSAVYQALTTVVQQTPSLYEVARRTGLIRPHIGSIPSAQVSEMVLHSTADLLTQLRRDNSRVVVLIIPSRYLWAGDQTVETDRVHRAFVALLRAAGLAVVDPRRAFENTGNPLGLHFAHDPHWTPTAHRIAAAQLAAALQDAPGRYRKIGNRSILDNGSVPN